MLPFPVASEHEREASDAARSRESYTRALFLIGLLWGECMDILPKRSCEQLSLQREVMQTLQIRSADRSEGHRAISAKHPRYIAVKIVDFGPDLMKCHSPADGQERLCRESELRRSTCCKSFCGAGEQIEARKGRHFIERTAARGLELTIFYSREGT